MTFAAAVRYAPLLTCDLYVVWQAFELAFLEGFLPGMAQEILVCDTMSVRFQYRWCSQDAAEEAGDTLLNRLGTPNMQSFGAYAYYSGPHLDDDASPSIGRVLKRDSSQVSPLLTYAVAAILS